MLAPRHTGVDTTLRLPADLKYAILDLVNNKTTVALAGVSRSWRQSAVHHPNYYRLISIFWHPRWNDIFTNAFSRLLANLDDAVRSRVPVSLRISISDFVDSDDLDEGDANHLITHIVYLARKNLVPLLRLALQHSLVSLDISFAGHHLDNVRDAFDVEAPYLRSLNVHLYNVRTEAIAKRPEISTWNPDAEMLSPLVFKGTASRLRTVSLSNMGLPATAIPAFANVAYISLTSSIPPDIRPALQFPMARSLYLSAPSRPENWPTNFLISLDFSGSRLTTLYLHQRDRIYDAHSVPTVSNLTLNGFRDVDLSSHWGTLNGALNLSIKQDAVGYWEFTCSSSSHSLTISGWGSPAVSWPWDDVSQKYGSVTTLLISQSVLEILCQTGRTLAFPVLTILHIVIDEAPSERQVAIFTCPKLTELHIETDQTWNFTPVDTDIASGEIAKIGRNLLKSRTCDLFLNSITLDGLRMGDTLKDIFRSIHFVQP